MKRVIDRSAAVFGLVMAAPVLGAVWLTVLICMGRPVFFRQTRPGLHGLPFKIVKFRTMTGAVSADGSVLPDDRRLTRLGSFLRTTSLDEIPQLWNVLVGDLSLVGPRPLLMAYQDRYTREQRRRQCVLPGITGWAQVNGRNAISWEEKFKLDVWYVDHWSLSLDLKVLWLTLLRVMSRSGISKEGHATMPEFMGSAEGSRTEDE